MYLDEGKNTEGSCAGYNHLVGLLSLLPSPLVFREITFVRDAGGFSVYNDTLRRGYASMEGRILRCNDTGADGDTNVFGQRANASEFEDLMHFLSTQARQELEARKKEKGRLRAVRSLSDVSESTLKHLKDSSDPALTGEPKTTHFFSNVQPNWREETFISQLEPEEPVQIEPRIKPLQVIENARLRTRGSIQVAMLGVVGIGTLAACYYFTSDFMSRL